MPEYSQDTIRIVESSNESDFAEPTAFGIISEDMNTEKFSISLFPALYEEHFASLKTRVLSIMDATYSDNEQRDAVKKLLKDTMNSWYNDNINHAYKRANKAKYNAKVLPFEP